MTLDDILTALHDGHSRTGKYDRGLHRRAVATMQAAWTPGTTLPTFRFGEPRRGLVAHLEPSIGPGGATVRFGRLARADAVEESWGWDDRVTLSASGKED